MASKYELKPNMVTPGPGTYKKKNYLEKALVVKEAKSEKEKGLDENDKMRTPGPGSYKIKGAFSRFEVKKKSPVKMQEDKFKEPK